MLNCYKNIMRFGEKSAIVSKKDLIVNLYTMKNIYKLKSGKNEGKIKANFHN